MKGKWQGPSIMFRCRVIVLGLVVALSSSMSSRADNTKDDSGFWFMGLAQGTFKKVDDRFDGFLWWFDGHARFLDDSNGFEQSIVRPGLGYSIFDDLSAWMGYGWIHTDPIAADESDEHRIWQQAIWSKRIEPFGFSSRTRLEQRFFEGQGETGWRLRQFLKLTYPLPFEPRLGLAFYDEAFFDLNDTDWGADTGFAQNRAFAGLSWKFDGVGSPKVEVGYLNQFLRGRSSDDGVNHILSVNLFLNF